MKQNEKKWNPIESLNGFADVLKFHGIDQEHWDENNKLLRPHEIGRREEEAIVAAYNGYKLSEDKLPDWKDGTLKYYPYFRMDAPSGSAFAFFVRVYGYSRSFVGSRQVFFGDNAYNNMIDATKKFIIQYRNSRTL